MNENRFLSEQELADIFSRTSGSTRRREMYGEWVTSDETEDEAALRKIAEEYHTRCDAYDRRYCTGISPRSGEPMPANGDELGAVNFHAREVINELERKSPYSREQIHKAIKKYADY